MTKKMSEKMMCDFIETTNAECANTDCKECLIKYFEKEIEMSEADKLFDELEFNKYELDTYIEYLNRKTREEITFRKDTRKVEKCRNVSSDYITMQELQAINLKCRELGWIE